MNDEIEILKRVDTWAKDSVGVYRDSFPIELRRYA
jgi:hypothetical protein